MKLELKASVLSACLVMSLLTTACGSANDTPSTEVVLVEEETQNLSVEKEETDVVASAPEEPELTEEELEALEWQDKLMADVESALNVRTEMDEESELAGKLEKGDVATVLEKGAEWSKIQSGNLEGYVKNEYCVFGADAFEYVKENCKTVATTTIDGLRVREEMNTESKVIKRLEEGEKLEVDTDAEVDEGWVAVIVSDGTYYVSAEYVTVARDTGVGETMEEIEEARRKEEEARKAAEAAAAAKKAEKAAQSSSVQNTDDLTLMAAIIYCEAGGEPYETQLAVGAVIMNRIQSSAYPNNLYDVLYQKGQFGPAGTGKLARVLAQGKATSSCYEAARAALAGQDNTGGCLFFNDTTCGRSGLVYGTMVFW